MKSCMRVQIGAVAVAALIAFSLVWVSAQQRGNTVAIDRDDIGGVVTSATGPEAGVWVIAETADLPTGFIRIVVTDDQGRYVLPDLPDATYEVFVRGYGLVDSARQDASPGQQLDLRAVVAPDARAAAQVYPAAWWLSLLEMPNDLEAQSHIVSTVKGCLDCHQLGSQATRVVHPSIASATSSSLEAWNRRTASGPSAPGMSRDFRRLGEHRQRFADWTDRVASGAVPSTSPPRPTGVERNLVLTLWDWGTPFDGRSDQAASDLRNPSVNANSLSWGVSRSTDTLNALDPSTHTSRIIRVPTDGPEIRGPVASSSVFPSPYWGDEDVWRRASDPRSVAIDEQGRVWLTARYRSPEQQPPFCDSNKFGEYFPLQSAARHVAVYDPEAEGFEYIDVCFSADHNEISEDNFIYYGGNGRVGWIDMDTWDETHDAEASQGWCPTILDTNGDGLITEWTEPDEAVDPMKDHRVSLGCYELTVTGDGAIWCSGNGAQDKHLVRLDKGSNPPETCTAELYEAPPGQEHEVIGSGGVQATRNGVIWQNWRVSGHFTSFDRSKCRVTNGPEATGQSCPEGWEIYRKDEPTYANSSYTSTESYLTHMDNYDTLGLGEDVPLYAEINADSLAVLVPATKEFVTLRMPYPLGFFARSATPRIDNPNTGWKGKALWSSYSTYAAWHIEGGKGALQKVVKLQMRPDPLAK